MSGTASWIVLFIAGLFLIIIGFEGALGLVIGVAFSPGSLMFYSDAASFTNSTDSFTPASVPTIPTVPTFNV